MCKRKVAVRSRLRQKLGKSLFFCVRRSCQLHRLFFSTALDRVFQQTSDLGGTAKGSTGAVQAAGSGGGQAKINGFRSHRLFCV